MRALTSLSVVPATVVGLALGAGAAGPSVAGASTGPANTGADAEVTVTQVQQATDRPLLRLGDRGQAVAAWQRQMNLLTGAGLPVDGIYGTTTEQATMNFQAFFGLRVDGIVGENTRALMRYLIAVTRDYTSLARYEGWEVNTFQSEGGFCFEVLSGDVWNVECGPLPPYPVSARSIALDGMAEVLVGSADQTIARVELETGSGPGLDADLTRDVGGTDRVVWTSPLPTDSVEVIRAYANDGSEVRAIVLDGTNPIQILERGDVGQAVAAWQGQLNELTGAGLVTDGVFGESTVQATRNFQAFFGLTVDGIVGPGTRGMMEYLLALT